MESAALCRAVLHRVATGFVVVQFIALCCILSVPWSTVAASADVTSRVRGDAGIFYQTPSQRDLQLESAPHYARHMDFRERESVKRELTWHEELRNRGIARRGRFSGDAAEHGTTAGADAAEKEVLLELFESTSGHDWTNKKGWENKSSDPCTVPWAGVYCQNNRVVSIELVYNNMAGPLPQSLGTLTALQQLVFYSNMLTGEIPSSIFELPVLTELDLNNNLLTGTLPTHVAAKSLQHLVLYTNKLQGALPSVWSTPKLRTLELSSNTFTGPAPAALGGMSSLTELVISRNNISGDYPASWGSLGNLTQLWTFNNELKGPLPESWQGMRSLLNVEMDSVTGEFPSWIGKWSEVQLMIIVRGALSGSLSEGLCLLRRVQTLWLFQNALSGSLPSCIGDWSNITQLELSDNKLSGAIPEGVRGLKQLEYLYLSRNAFATTLPAGLGSLENLQIMDLSSNSFTGGIPVAYNGLAGIMVDWALCYNKLSGPLTKDLSPLFQAISQFTCALYNNPWQCPIESLVPKACDCICDSCNSQRNRDSCKSCVATDTCGFCQDGSSCLHGGTSGPEGYDCKSWHFGSTSNCSAFIVVDV